MTDKLFHPLFRGMEKGKCSFTTIPAMQERATSYSDHGSEIEGRHYFKSSASSSWINPSSE